MRWYSGFYGRIWCFVLFLFFVIFFNIHTTYLIPKPMCFNLKPKAINYKCYAEYHSILMYYHVPVALAGLSSKTGVKGVEGAVQVSIHHDQPQYNITCVHVCT